jgi:flagellar biosynthesis component FlhA
MLIIIFSSFLLLKGDIHTISMHIENIRKKPVDTFELQLGYGLIPLVDKDKGLLLLEKIKIIRQELNAEHNIVLQKVRIVDHIFLDKNEYVFLIEGIEADRNKIDISNEQDLMKMVSRIKSLIKEHLMSSQKYLQNLF